MLKLMSFFDPQAKAMLTILDRVISCDNSQTIKDFKWEPIPLKKTFLDMANSVQSILDSNSKTS